jgi:hypothetical protein
MTARPRKKCNSAKSPVTAATLGVEGLEKVVPIGDALIVVLAIVEARGSRCPRQAAAARADWSRRVDRALFDAPEGREATHRPRSAVQLPAPATASFAKSRTEVVRIVRARLDAKGWPAPLSADAKQVAELAWEQIMLRCNLNDSESLKRLQRERKRWQEAPDGMRSAPEDGVHLRERHTLRIVEGPS